MPRSGRDVTAGSHMQPAAGQLTVRIVPYSTCAASCWICGFHKEQRPVGPGTPSAVAPVLVSMRAACR